MARLFSGLILGFLLVAFSPAHAAMMPTFSHAPAGHGPYHAMQGFDFSYSNRSPDGPGRGFGRDEGRRRDDDRDRFSRPDFLMNMASLPSRFHDRDHRSFHYGFGFPHLGHHYHHNPVSNVPLPAALPLFATGLASLVYARRRKVKKA